MSSIGSRIRARREELGLSQDALGKRLGYKSRSSINKIELDQRNLTQSKIKAIADALETTPAYIMGWEDKEGNVSPNEQPLTGGEEALLELFRRVPDDQQQLVLQLIRAAMDSPNLPKDQQHFVLQLIHTAMDSPNVPEDQQHFVLQLIRAAIKMRE